MTTLRRGGVGEPGGLFGNEDNTPRRRWLALIVASLVLQFSYWPLVAALTASLDGDDASGAAVALGLALAPITFVLLAFLSRHPRAPGAVLKAMALLLLVGMPVALLNTIVGIFAGYAAGGVVALRPLPEGRPYRPRIIGVAVVAAYLFVLQVVGALEFALLSAAALPLAVSGVADEAMLGRAAARGDDTP